MYEALKRGAAVQVRLILECPHYVLLTGLTDDGRVLLFDPYYEEEDDPEFDEEYRTDEIHFLYDMPKRANRSVSIERLNRTGCLLYTSHRGYRSQGSLPAQRSRRAGRRP